VQTVWPQWTSILGGGYANGEGGKLSNVKYDTKVRHIKNEFAISRRFSDQDVNDPPVVRIFSIRPVKRFGIEVGYDLLMEYLDGHNLADKVVQTNLDLADKIRVLYQASAALDYVQSKKVVHLDIKPSNFMLVNGRVRLIDFGVSVCKGFKSQSVTGTAGFMSPEQICKGTFDERTDMFAFGIAFAAFFGGKILNQPQEKLTSKEMRNEAKYKLETDEKPALLGDIPELVNVPEIAELLRKCTIPRLDKRLPNCALFSSELIAIAEKYGIEL